MAALARKSVAREAPAPKLATLIEATSDHAPVPSPAQLMQAQLQLTLDRTPSPEPFVAKWSPGLAILFMIGSAAALWLGIVLAIRSVF